MYKRILCWFLICLGVAILLFSVYQQLTTNTKLLSPVSASLDIENLWFPQEVDAAQSNSFLLAPPISAKAAFFVDSDSGQVLYQKNQTAKLPIASLVKVMTALVALDYKKLYDEMVVSEQAAQTEPDKMYLKSGEKISVEKLFQGLFLVSANDASEVLAEKTTGSRDYFIKLMNQKALTLGLKNTHFINPSGLEEDDKIQYSTALETAVFSRHAIYKYPFLLGITSRERIFIEETPSHQSYDLWNGINLVTTYPGVKGFKTGFTPTAGLTLVTYAEKGDKKVLGVLLNSVNRRDDARVMLDYAFQKLGVEQ